MANYKKFIFVDNTNVLSKTDVTTEQTFADEAAKWDFIKTNLFADSTKPWFKSIIFRKATNEIYNRGIAYGLNPTDAARITTLENWRKGLVVNDGAETPGDVVVSGTNVDLTYNQEDGKINITGLTEDYTAITLIAHKDATETDAVVKAAINFGTSENQDKLSKGSDLKKVADYATDIVSEEHTAMEAAVAKATTTVSTTSGSGLVVTPDATATDGHTEYKLSQNLKFTYVAATAATGTVGEEGYKAGVPAHIELQDKTTSAKVAEFNVSDIIGNGVLESSSYDDTTGILTLTFKQADGTTKAESIDLKKMLDINDMSIEETSQDYLKVTLQGDTEGDTQAVFGAKIVKMAEAHDETKYAEGDELPEGKAVGDTKTEALTGIPDALDVKTFVLSQTTDLSVSAEGDDYITASVAEDNNKKIDITANVQDITADAGTRGTWSVTDAGEASLSGETNPSITASEKSLVDGKKVAGAITGYTDAKVAQEAAERTARIEAAIKALDVTDLKSTKEGTTNNIELTLQETDGKVSELVISESYATITRTARVAKNEYDNGEDATAPALVVTSGDEGKLVKASDVALVVSYVGDLDTRITNRVQALEDEVLDWAEV